MAGTGHYNSKGLYNRYDKNHKAREANDYYSTPPDEVLNILCTFGHDFSGETILEPCAGEGHMAKGIWDYIKETNALDTTLLCTEYKIRKPKFEGINIDYNEKYDFLADDYPDFNGTIDWIIMNPPYATIEPFMIRALEIAKKGVIMLGRIQCLEGEGRYEHVFKDNPPTYVYTYVDRIQCWKNGEKPTGTSAQGYAWFVWQSDKAGQETIHRWIRRVDKA